MTNSWTDRIKNAEFSPPENGWDNITTSLDESFSGYEFPAKLYNFETIPPSGTWSKIQDIFTNEEIPVIPLKRGSFNTLFTRYAIAACLIGLISFATIKIFSGNKTETGVALVKPVSAPQNNIPADSNLNSESGSPAPAQLENDKDNQALEESKHTYARLDYPSRSLPGRISSLYSSPAQLSTSLSLPAGGGLAKNPQIQYSYRAAVNDSPEDKDGNRYLMFKDSEGRFIKISNKLAGLFCCVSGEEKDENCNDQLKKWREKIASSSFIPSPDNFMDILDLVSSLQDNRN